MLATHTPYTLVLLAVSLFGSTSAAAPDADAASSSFDLHSPENAAWRHIQWSHHSKRALGKAWTGTTTLAGAGVSGVAAM